MRNDFDTQDLVDEKIQTAAGIENEFSRKVFAQNSENKGPDKLVIIGGGACGMAAATKIRRHSDFEITVISRDSYTAYSHCGIPFVLSWEINSFEKLIVKSSGFFQEKQIDIKLNENVRSINYWIQELFRQEKEFILLTRFTCNCHRKPTIYTYKQALHYRTFYLMAFSP